MSAAGLPRPPFFMSQNDQDKHLFRYLLVFMAVWVCLLTVIPSVLYSALPLDTIETVMWSHPFSMGNAKHPPLAGWLAGIATLASGHADSAMYLLSQLMLAIGFVYIYRLGKEFFSAEKAVLSAALLATILFYTFDSAKFNVNLPHMALWPMMVFYCWRGVKYDRTADWVLFGAASALAILSKLFGFALLLALFLFIATGRETRKYFRRPGPYLAFAVFLLLLAPYLAWLARHDFLPFTYIANRVSEEKLDPAFNFLRILLESLFPIVPPLFLLWLSSDHPVQSLLGFRPRSIRPASPEALRLALFVQFTPIVLLTLMAGTGMMIDSMWEYPVYFITGFFLMAVLQDVSFRQFRKLFCLLMALLVGVQAFDVFYWLTKTRKHGGHFNARSFSAVAQEFYRERTGRDIPLAFGDMWYAGCIMQYLPDHPYAGSYEDPYDELRFRSILDNEGALGVYNWEEQAEQLAGSLGLDPDELKRDSVEFRSICRAPYGKAKMAQAFLVVIPPLKEHPRHAAAVQE